MTVSPLTSMVRRLSRLPAPAAGELSDAELLDRFRHSGEDAAFALLVQRHGPAVLGVCRRLLGNAADADDAFQATFLVLLRKAGSVRRRSSVGCWLYGVACRVAAKARARRPTTALSDETFTAPGAGPAGEAACRELAALLDEEVRGLPEKYRTAFILCGLEGKTCEQAARELGWPKSTLAHRLARARELLRRRLSRRGVAVPAALLSAALAQEAAASPVPALLTLATVRLARQASSGRMPGGPAVVLAEAVVKRASARWGVVLGLVAALGLAAAGAAASRQEKEPAAAPAAPAAPAGPGPHVDREGLPLPAEALARVGSGRFRHGRRVWNLDYSPDGKLLASSGEGLVRVWDSATGKLVWQFTTADARYARDGVFSPDGKTVVVVDGETCRWLDARSGREVRSCAVKFPKEQHIGRLGAGGTLLVVAEERPGKDLVVYELPSGRERFRTTARRMWSGNPIFSPDGTTLAAFERSEKRFLKGYQVRLFDTATGRSPGEFDSDEMFRSPSFSRDGKKLLAHNAKQATVWSVPAGEVLHRVGLAKDGVSMAAALAPDGKSVVAGNQGLDDTVQVELDTGRELHRFRVLHTGTAFAFTPDGGRLAIAAGGGWISQWDLASGRRLDASIDAFPNFYPLRFDATGRVLEVSNKASLAVEWRTGREVWRMPVPDGATGYWVAVSPDRSRMIGANADYKNAVWDTASGKLLYVLPKDGWLCPVFSPDGKTLYSGGGPVQAWDVSTGRQLPAFDKEQHSTGSLTVSPDGRRLAAAEQPQAPGDPRRAVLVWDRASGGEPRRFLLRSETMRPCTLAFSPDGSHLAAVGGEARPGQATVPGAGDGFLTVWDVDTGKEKFFRSAPASALECVDYSADGRLLVTGGDDRAVRLWEVATGQERHRFTGHESEPFRIAFSPDGKFVASAASDAPIFVWDVEGCYGKPPSAVPFAEGEGKGLWDALDSADAAAAFGAMRQLLARPGPAVALLRQHLRPAPAIDEKTLQGLLEELDAADFAAREKASKDLEALADRAAPLLRKALAGNASAEARRRIPPLLEAAAPAAPERRREVRAVEVLERLGTGGARELLAALAGGDKEALLTREARAALGRLAGH